MKHVCSISGSTKICKPVAKKGNICMECKTMIRRLKKIFETDGIYEDIKKNSSQGPGRQISFITRQKDARSFEGIGIRFSRILGASVHDIDTQNIFQRNIQDS